MMLKQKLWNEKLKMYRRKTNTDFSKHEQKYEYLARLRKMTWFRVHENQSYM